MQKVDLQKILKNLAKPRQALSFSIDPAKCKGCDMCKKNCPAGAISGNLKEVHQIDPSICLCCGSCQSVCPFKAVLSTVEE